MSPKKTTPSPKKTTPKKTATPTEPQVGDGLPPVPFTPDVAQEKKPAPVAPQPKLRGPSLDDLFSWHKPTKQTVPKHARVTAACDDAEVFCRKLRPGTTFDDVNAMLKGTAEVLVEQCPGSADLSAAIRSLRLARNACNEAIAMNDRTGRWDMSLGHAAGNCVREARWQANAAIALEGK